MRPSAYHFFVPSPQVVPPAGDTPSLPPSIDADLRLIRVHIDQQSQLLAVMHEMLASQQALFTAMQAQLLENDKKINELLRLVEELHTHLNKTPANATQG